MGGIAWHIHIYMDKVLLRTNNLTPLEQVVFYILLRLGKTGKTKLVKLLFLIDRELSRKGESIFKEPFKKYYYGPYNPEIEKVLDSLETKGLIEISVKELLFDEGFKFEIRPSRYISPENLEFVKKNRYDIDKIIDNLGRKTLDEILEEVYSLEEVRNTGFNEPIKYKS